MVSPRVTHNDETPVQVTINGNQQEVLVEDVHTLRNQLLLTIKGGQNLMAGNVAPAQHRQGSNRGNIRQTAHLGPLFDPEMVPPCLCQGFACTMPPCTCVHICYLRSPFCCLTHFQRCQLTSLKV